MQKGDIVLLPFPFTDLTGFKKRPVVVLYSGKFDIIVSFITSQEKILDVNDLRLLPNNNNRLKKLSVLKVNKLATIDKSLVIGKIGELDEVEIFLINEKLKNIFNI